MTNNRDKLLADRVILVTGAGHGIGRAVAQGLGCSGATVILAGEKLAELESCYDEMELAGCPQPALYPIDLVGAVADDYFEMSARLLESFGRLDGLLHNAAILPYLSRIKDYEVEDWAKTIQVNLHAPFLITQAMLPLLANSQDARIVFTADEAGRNPRAFWGAYSVSKHGAEALMQILAAELIKSSIRVNSFDPGAVDTAMRKRAFAEDKEDLTVRSAEDLVPCYLWLFGPESRDTHGQALSITDIPSTLN